MTNDFPVDRVQTESGTQVRAEISETLVADYAERMRDGARFPPIVLFYDNALYHLADGFHRLRAAQRLGLPRIDADVRAGTKADALWYALGANREHGKRLSVADTKHAVTTAIEGWPEMSAQRIAQQVGCSASYVSRIKACLPTRAVLPDRVVGTDGRSYPSSPSAATKAREDAALLLKEGRAVKEVSAATGIGRDTVVAIQRNLGLAVDKTRDGIQKRRDVMRQMATEGHSSRQIAATLGISERRCRINLRHMGVTVLADDVTRGTHHHDSTRIAGRIVMDAENLLAGANLIEFADLDHAHITEWLASLKRSRDQLGLFIRRLMQEQARHQEDAHGEAAQSQAV